MGDYEYADAERGQGWIQFAVVLFFVSGLLSAIDGVAAILGSDIHDTTKEVLFENLKLWGWAVLILGLLEFAIAVAIQTGSSWGRWPGIAVASLGIVAHLGFVQANPWWSLVVIVLDVLVIYALTMYGGRRFPA